MSRLTRVELRRMWARRLPQLTMLLMVVFTLLGLYGVSSGIQNLDADRAQAQEWYQEELTYWEQSQDPELIQDCLDQQAREQELIGDQNVDYGCVQPKPQVEDFLPGPSNQLEASGTLLLGLSLPLALLALVMGSSATAAEFSHKTLSTWLTFEPRRSPVYGSKVLAAALAPVPMAVAFVGLILLGVAALFQMHSVENVLTSQQWAELGWLGLRLVAATAVAGGIGAAAGLLFKHTGAVLGVGLIYGLVVEGVIVTLAPGLRPWLLSNNAQAWINGGYQVVSEFVCDAAGNCTEKGVQISQGQGALVLGLFALLVMVVSWLVFRRRDID